MSILSHLKRSAAVAALCLAAGVTHAGVTESPKQAPDRYSADQAFFAVVLTPQSFCKTLQLPYVAHGPGCGGMIVHDHNTGPTSPTAFLGRNGNNFIGIPDAWWTAVREGRVSASYLQIIIAHEEGHLFCGHQLGQPTRENEIIADRFAGAAMRWVWNSIRLTNEQIGAMINEAYAPLAADALHPPADERMATFIAGFHHPETATCAL